MVIITLPMVYYWENSDNSLLSAASDPFRYRKKEITPVEEQDFLPHKCFFWVNFHISHTVNRSEHLGGDISARY